MNVDSINSSRIGTDFAGMQASSRYVGANTATQGPAMSSTQAVQEEVETLNEEQQIQEQRDKLNELAQQLNKELSPLNTNVTFNFSEEIEGLFVTVSERDTNRIIRKIPSDEAMELMAKMKEVVGIIFSKQA